MSAVSILPFTFLPCLPFYQLYNYQNFDIPICDAFPTLLSLPLPEPVIKLRNS